MYLSDKSNVEYVLEQTDLSLDELESIVGRFDKDHHSWANELKGLYTEDFEGNKRILHHFTRKVLWESYG